MTAIALTELIEGAAALEPGEHDGWRPRRLPPWARAQHDDTWFDLMEQAPTGVSLRFATAASLLRLRLHTRSVRPAGAGTVRPHKLALVVDGALSGHVTIPEGDVVIIGADRAVAGRERRDPSVVTLALPSGGREKQVEIMLPHDCAVEIISLDADAAIAPPPAGDSPLWTHYGSSISHGLEASAPDRTWPARVALANGWRLRNLSFGGNAQLDPFVARMIRDTPADLITLKVGINLVNVDSMRARTMLPAVHGFLDLIRDGHPDTPVVLITAIACPAHEHTPGPTVDRGGSAAGAERALEADGGALTLAGTRRIIERAHADRRPDDPHLHLVDGRTLLGEDDAGLLGDGLHPTEEGLGLIARRFQAAVAGLPALAGLLGGRR
ncbi:SGNH/GDSL hydrolase family protein [Nonomuraea sp. SBT364]|uniref:SGNH/GDSL hydrolase family protein n=1 Tax=Nonomuraea sp. SBT364 TaxID=1580530 RepID=UPI00066CDEDC|nr:SGNH/GDSL hydrolase family protein [Nonomuraea sp. SBT364]